EVDTERLTASGLAVGTPHYLSPEQAAAEKDVGPKADQYALACVLYEMLVGEPPFTGPTASAIAMRHIAEEPRPMRLRRHSTPVGVDAAVMRAMEKVPADRYPTVKQFAEAAGDTHATLAPAVLNARRPSVTLRILGMVGATVLLFAILLARWGGVAQSPTDLLARTFGPTLDTSRYAILPFRRDSASSHVLRESEVLYDAIARWEGVRPVELYQVRDAVTRQGAVPLSSSSAARIARSLGAGRFIWGEISQSRGATRLHAGVFDTNRPGEPLGDATMRLAVDGLDGDSLLSLAVDSLLFGRNRPSGDKEGNGGTHSRPARQAFLRGLEATTSWDLAKADSEFHAATEYDPRYGRALFWLAQVRVWGRTNTSTVRTLAERATSDGAQLSATESQLAKALVALSSARYDEACAIYESLKARDSSMFAAWYGIGECNAKDNIVVRGAGGLNFRSSYRRALEGYERAFMLLPSINRSFSAKAYSRLQKLLKTNVNDLRYGHPEHAETVLFGAYASWNADTLAFTPQPLSNVEDGTDAVPSTLSEAIDHQRLQFNRIATTWATSLPGDPNALEALAVSLELLGNSAALDTLRRAQKLATEPGLRLRLAARETWLRLKASVPDRPLDIVAARALADSILRHTSPTSQEDASLLLNLAALIGDLPQSLSLVGRAARPTVVGIAIADDVLREALVVQVFAAFGGPADSLQRAGERLESSLRDAVRIDRRREAVQRLAGRAAMLSFPFTNAVFRDSSVRAADPLLAAQYAFLRGDTARVRQLLANLARKREGYRPGDIGLDAIVPEAWLLAAIGDVHGAVSRLDPVLGAIRTFDPGNFDDFTRAALLGRALKLRAALAACQKERATQEKFTRAFIALTTTAAKTTNAGAPYSKAGEGIDGGRGPFTCSAVSPQGEKK
ncbi:MAG: hypothetical protein JWM95_1608, partial [Gemmatimonadetes bacterium]|nr:hypothetical protein [Gemmatimonadota bacterium]